jgi:V/A-type H+/Na+-transporting ATPase subunit K
MDEPTRTFKFQLIQSVVVLCLLLSIMGTFFCATAFAASPGSEEAVQSQTTLADAGNLKYGLMAAAVAFGLGALGAGVAIAYVGAAAVGAVAEKPQIGGQALIFVALAEGLVVFGFITALMILGKV